MELDDLMNLGSGALIVASVIGLAISVAMIIAYWKIFTKAGKPGWHSIIPLLSSYDLYDLSWSKTVGIVALILMILTPVLSLVPFLGIVIAIALLVLSTICNYKLSKSFGYDVGFFLGLTFLPPIFYMILGFGSAQYQGRIGDDISFPNGRAGVYNVNNQINVNQYSGNPAGTEQPIEVRRIDPPGNVIPNEQTRRPYEPVPVRNQTPDYGRTLPPGRNVIPTASVQGVSGLLSGYRQTLNNSKECVFGKDSTVCTVLFDQRADVVSRRHCRVYYNGGSHSFQIQDMGSSNGTMLVRGKMQRRVPTAHSVDLKDGDLICFPGNISVFRFNQS